MRVCLIVPSHLGRGLLEAPNEQSFNWCPPAYWLLMVTIGSSTAWRRRLAQVVQRLSIDLLLKQLAFSNYVIDHKGVASCKIRYQSEFDPHLQCRSQHRVGELEVVFLAPSISGSSIVEGSRIGSY